MSFDQDLVSMEHRAPSTTKALVRTFACRCGVRIPKTSYMCSPCWGELNVVQQAELKTIRRALQDRRFERLPQLARG